MAEIFSDEDTTRLFQLVHMFQRSALLHMGEQRRNLDGFTQGQ